MSEVKRCTGKLIPGTRNMGRFFDLFKRCLEISVFIHQMSVVFFRPFLSVVRKTTLFSGPGRIVFSRVTGTYIDCKGGAPGVDSCIIFTQICHRRTSCKWNSKWTPRKQNILSVSKDVRQNIQSVLQLALS